MGYRLTFDVDNEVKMIIKREKNGKDNNRNMNRNEGRVRILAQFDLF